MTERQELVAEAERLGLSFAKNAKSKHIQDMIEKAQAEKAVQTVRDSIAEELSAVEEHVEYIEDVDAVETTADIEARLRKEFEIKLQEQMTAATINMEKNVNEASNTRLFGKPRMDAIKKATKLIRCIVTCRDPLKNSWEGEIISVANDVIGEQKKYIPFNVDEGYHVPQIILNVLRDKKCTVFVNKRVNGEQVKVGKEINAYGIELLDPLTEHELGVLAAEQQARRSVDE